MNCPSESQASQDPGLHKKLCDRLSTAKDDSEAAHLHGKLKELQQKK
jgi:hypothetical protein